MDYDTKSVAFVPMMNTGHLNPMLALAKGMADKGVQCTFYIKEGLKSDYLLDLSPNVRVTNLLPSKDEAVYKLLQEGEVEEISRVILGAFKDAVNYLEGFMNVMIDERPDAIIYDPFLTFPLVAASILQIPTVATVTFPGVNMFPSIIATDEQQQQELVHLYRTHPTLQEFNSYMKRKFGVDVLEYCLPLSNVIPTGLQICTGLPEFDVPLPSIMKKTYGEISSKQISYVGPMLLQKGRVSFTSTENSEDYSDGPLYEPAELDAPFPIDKVAKAKEEGKTIIYCSMGTVATSMFWDFESESQAFNFGAKRSGKKHCRTLWQRIFKALGNNPKYLVVLATIAADPHAFDELDIPSNFILRRKCPQLEILKHTDVFITHGGANSMMESIVAEVPMLVMPYFADQYANGDSVGHLGLGLNYKDPVKDATEKNIAFDISRLLDNHDKYSEACKMISHKLYAAGGVLAAIERIERYISDFDGHILCSERFTDLENPLAVEDEEPCLRRSASCGQEASPVHKLRKFLNLPTQ